MTGPDAERRALGAPPCLRVDGLTKAFGPFTAVDSLSFALDRGDFVGVIGENGAGKSTLLNMLSGVIAPSAGSIELDGVDYRPSTYHEATTLGVFRVFQELALVPNLSVFENFYLSHEKQLSTLGVPSRRRMVQHARSVLERFDHGWIDPTRLVSSYPFAVRQVVEILRAFALADLLGQERPVLLLDEPTAGVAQAEITFLKDVLDAVREESAILFVSHRLSELISWSDRIVVLKDGEMVADRSASSIGEEELHFLMVGRTRDKDFYREDRQRSFTTGPALSTGPGAAVDCPGGSRLVHPTLDLLGATAEGFTDVDLTVRPGEIIGVAGVLASGKTELGRAVAGELPLTAGTVRYRGADLTRQGLRKRQQMGIGYVPPERKREAIIESFSVAQNISLARIATGTGGPLVNLRVETADANRLRGELGIRTEGIRQLISRLSGGNQQKCVLARWLVRGVELLVLDNPTRGVDSGAKEEIYGVIRDLADADVAILLISDDLNEVIGMSNEILIMKDGRVSGRRSAPEHDKPSETELLAAMV